MEPTLVVSICSDLQLEQGTTLTASQATDNKPPVSSWFIDVYSIHLLLCHALPTLNSSSSFGMDVFQRPLPRLGRRKRKSSPRNNRRRLRALGRRYVGARGITMDSCAYQLYIYNNYNISYILYIWYIYIYEYIYMIYIYIRIYIYISNISRTIVPINFKHLLLFLFILLITIKHHLHTKWSTAIKPATWYPSPWCYITSKLITCHPNYPDPQFALRNIASI